MNLKKILAIGCMTVIAAGAAAFAGCGIFGNGNPVAVEKSGFSVELTSKYDELSLPAADDDVVRDNMIIRYESKKILFSVSQIPRDEIFPYHVYDLETFATFMLEDYFGEKADVNEFKSQDGSIDGCKFSMSYTNSYGDRNVQTDYLFVGTENFYEVSMVTFEDEFKKLADDMDAIVLTCKADDGLNKSEKVALTNVTFSGLKFNLNETFEFDEDTDCYKNGAMLCTVEKVDDAKFLSLDGLLNHYSLTYGDYDSSVYEDKTANGTNFIYCIGESATSNGTKYGFVAALFIDNDGNGYIIDFLAPQTGIYERFLLDGIDFAKSASGVIDNFRGSLTAQAKEFTDETAAEVTEKLGYTLNLDDTFMNYGWDEDTKSFTLWSGEYNRYITVTKSTYTTTSSAGIAWRNGRPAGSSRECVDYEGAYVGRTYDFKNAQKHYYEYAIFIETNGGIVIVTISLNTGYFEEMPSVAEVEVLAPQDKLLLDAVKDIVLVTE